MKTQECPACHNGTLEYQPVENHYLCRECKETFFSIDLIRIAWGSPTRPAKLTGIPKWEPGAVRRELTKEEAEEYRNTTENGFAFMDVQREEEKT